MNENTIGLPKNMRQIGEKEEGCKVLIEDYVISYLNQVAVSLKEELVVAAMFGYARELSGVPTYFVYAAVCCKGQSSYQEMIKNNASYLRTDYLQYFPDLSFLGFGIISKDCIHMETEGIYAAELASILGTPRILYVMDPGEYLEKVYCFQSGKTYALKGFFYFYEKNEGMQNFLVTWNEKNNIQVEKPVRDVSTTLRTHLNERKAETRRFGLATALYAASLITLIISCGIGINSMSRYDKMREIEGKIGELALMIEQGDLSQVVTNQGNLSSDWNSNDHTDSFPSELSGENGTGNDLTAFGENGTDSGIGDFGEDETYNVSNTFEKKDIDGSSDASGEEEREAEDVSQTDTISVSGTQIINIWEDEDLPGMQSGSEEAEMEDDNSAGSLKAAEDTSSASSDDMAGENENDNLADGARENGNDNSADTTGASSDATTVRKPVDYIIRPGDTLTGISYRNYGTILMVSRICELNEIKNEDNIMIGQKIVLP